MFRDYRSYDKLKPHDGCKKLNGFVMIYLMVCPVEVVDRPPEPITPRNVKTVLTNFFVLSIFGQFDYELETRLLKSEFVNTVLTFRGVIGSGGLSTTSTGHTIRYINRFG
jgi:hypothetical protein